MKVVMLRLPMKTKATRAEAGIKALLKVAQYARTHAGDLQACGRTREARAMHDCGDWLFSMVALFRASGHGLPVQDPLS